jgi:hypothetical protein
VSERLTRDAVLDVGAAYATPSPEVLRQLRDLALRALELDAIYGHELRPVDLRAILRKP